MRLLGSVSRLFGLLSVVALGGCLFSGDDSVAEGVLSAGGWKEDLQVKTTVLEGTGIDRLTERVRGEWIFHAVPDFAWNSYTSPYRRYWSRHMALGTRFDVKRTVYLLFDITDTAAVTTETFQSLFLGMTDPDSVPLTLELPEDTAFSLLIDSSARFPLKEKREVSLSWKLVSTERASSADSLRRYDDRFAEVLADQGFASPLSATLTRARGSRGDVVWKLPLPTPLVEEVLPSVKEQKNNRFLVVQLSSSFDPPLRLISPFSDTTLEGKGPRVLVGDWAERKGGRSAEKLTSGEPATLELLSGSSDSVLVRLPWEELLDSIDIGRFTRLEEMVVRAKLRLIPSSPMISEREGKTGEALPVEARVWIDSTQAIKNYRYTEVQTGNFPDSTVFPSNWIFFGSPERSDTVTVEIGEAVRAALHSGDDRGIRITLFIGRQVLDSTINYQGSNQLLPATIDKIDWGAPSGVKWELELQTVDLQEVR